MECLVYKYWNKSSTKPCKDMYVEHKASSKSPEGTSQVTLWALPHLPLQTSLDLGRPWRQTTSRKNKCATCEASIVLLHGIKCAIFENISTTTKTESCFLKVQGRPNTKSMLRCSHGAKGIGRKVYSPVFCCLLLATWQTRQWDNSRIIPLDTQPIKLVLQ